MADKLPQTVVVAPTFTDGEIPLATKLTVLAAQSRAANRKLEKAVGDHLDQGRPYTASLGSAGLSIPPQQQTSPSDVSGYPTGLNLDIASISRFLGPAEYLNPEHLFGSGTRSIDYVVNHTFWPLHVIELPYRPQNSTISIVESSAGVFTNAVGSVAALAADGDYYYDSSKGRIHTFTRMADADHNGTADPGWSATITYEVNFGSALFGGENTRSSMNVIPSVPQLEAGSGLTDVTGAAAGYQRFELPTATHGFSERASYGSAVTLLTAEDPNYDVQLEVPYILQTELSAGDQIPEGFMVLKNYTTGQAYTEAVLLYVDAEHVDVGNVDLTAEIAAGDVLYLVTVGNSVSSAIHSLRRAIRNPGSKSWGSNPISVDYIKDLFNYAGRASDYIESLTTGWHNPAPQYLHRDGYNHSEHEYNDYNVMRGDLGIGVESGSIGSFVKDAEVASHKIFFCHPDNNYIKANGDGAMRHATMLGEAQSRFEFNADLRATDFNFGDSSFAETTKEYRYAGIPKLIANNADFENISSLSRRGVYADFASGTASTLETVLVVGPLPVPWRFNDSRVVITDVRFSVERDVSAGAFDNFSLSLWELTTGYVAIAGEVMDDGQESVSGLSHTYIGGELVLTVTNTGSAWKGDIQEVLVTYTISGVP